MDFPDIGHLSDDALVALRERMIAGNEAVGVAMVEGRASGEAKEGAHIRAALVDRVDACLLSRGVEVPAPFWLVDDD